MGYVASLFTANETQWRTEALISQRTRVRANTVRIADIAVLSTDAPFEEVVTAPPLICIEIMSPEDRLVRAELVLADYFGMGVANIWLIDPIRRVAYTYGPAGLQLADPTQLTVSGTPIHLDLTDAFARLDQAQARRPK